MHHRHADLPEKQYKQITACEEPSRRDAKLLEEDGKQCTDHSSEHGDNEYEAVGLSFEYALCGLKPQDETDSAEEEPVKPAAHSEHDNS